MAGLNQASLRVEGGHTCPLLRPPEVRTIAKLMTRATRRKLAINPLCGSAHNTIDNDDHVMGNLTKYGQQLRMAQEGAAHDQLVVYEEGRGDNHPEADALVHVQLTSGLVD